MTLDDSVMNFIRDYLWAPLLGLVTWAWNRNEREHKEMRDDIASVRKDASDSHSVLMDRIVTHVDSSVKEAITFMKEEDKKLGDETALMRTHITKLFENAERDRSEFRDLLMHHVQRSEDRHIELLKGQQDLINTIHVGLSKKADK